MTLLASDRALLDAFRGGKPRALRQVYEAYVDQVTRQLAKGFSFASAGRTMTFRGFANAWDLECSVQDVFVKAFNDAARQAYDGVSPFGPYLSRIARNHVISELRSEKREMRRRERLAAEPREPAPSPEGETLHAELVTIVAGFRETLDDRDRTFLRLRYEDELPLTETARRVGLSRMSARTLDRKLRQRFAKYLRRAGYVASGADPSLSLLVAA